MKKIDRRLFLAPAVAAAAATPLLLFAQKPVPAPENFKAEKERYFRTRERSAS